MLACGNASTGTSGVILMDELYVESPRDGFPSAVRAEVDNADAVERALTDENRCNWLTGYGDGVNEYCGTPGGSVCKIHVWYERGWL